ncbi:hypothetical protein L218DRAFT_128098 [Marasmius fiardii PR-910]|nr:hypothetical protein L218DRAFT_128098 [Marasmius fiardii PR-910]
MSRDTNMFRSTLKLIYTIVLPKPSFQVPPSKPDPVYYTATHFPTIDSHFEVSRTPHGASRRRRRSNSVKTTSSISTKTPIIGRMRLPSPLSAASTKKPKPMRRNTIGCCSCSCPYEISGSGSAYHSALPYQLPGLDFMSAVASSLLLESPAHRPTHSTPRKTPHRRRTSAPADSPTPLPRAKDTRKDSDCYSSGFLNVAYGKRRHSTRGNDDIQPYKNTLELRLPDERRHEDDDEEPSAMLRRSSGRTNLVGGDANSSFLEALKRSSMNLSMSSLDERTPDAEILPDKVGQITSSTTVLTPALAFTLDLSPILEDLSVFHSDGLLPALPTLPSLATVSTDLTGNILETVDAMGIFGLRSKESEEREIQREVESRETEVPCSDVTDHKAETDVRPEAQTTLNTSRKPSLVLQRASIAFSDEDQSAAHLPALTLTGPTPELTSKPVLEAINPLLPSIFDYGREIAVQEMPTVSRPILNPTVATDQSVSSLCLPLFIQAHATSASPSSSQYLRPPSPLLVSSSVSRPMPIPEFPRCTFCGFGFGSGFDLAGSSDMLNVSRVPCERCEEQWRKCVQWYYGGVDTKSNGDSSGVKPRFSWLPTRRKDLKEATSTSKQKRRSLSILPGLGKRISLIMATVPIQTTITVGRRQDETDGEVDELGGREFCRKQAVSVFVYFTFNLTVSSV